MIKNNNQFKYLFGLLTQTSTYGNNEGRATWAKAQLLEAYQDSVQEEVFVAMAAAGFGSFGGRNNKGIVSGRGWEMF